MFEYIAAILLSVAAALLLRSFGLSSFEHLIAALASFVGGSRGDDGWPRGVQEEDRDMPWGRMRRSVKPNPTTEPPPPTPQLLPVQPTIRSR